MLLAYYSSCWRTRDVEQDRTRPPAATAAGVVNTLGSFGDLFDTATGGGSQAIAPKVALASD